MHELEAEKLGHLAHGSVGERSGDVPDPAQLLFGELLDFGQMVVAGAHHRPNLGVGAPRLLRRRDGFARSPGEFVV